MDRQTLAAYDRDAAAFARRWHEQPEPRDLQDVVAQFFVRGGITADIGCGSGREAAWLNASGYSAVGFDACEALLAEARQRYPSFKFLRSDLPELRGIAAEAYDNVLCDTVIMHLAPALIPPSVARLIDIVKPSGVLYLSWCVTADADMRDAHGRLYAAFDAALVRAELASTTILVDEEVVGTSSGKKIHRFVVKKPGLPPRL